MQDDVQPMSHASQGLRSLIFCIWKLEIKETRNHNFLRVTGSVEQKSKILKLTHQGKC